MVLYIFNSLSKLIKLSEITIDNNVFRLHYKLTAIFLLAFSILITSSQHLGNPIHCTKTDDVPQSLIDTYCWITTTFSVPTSWNKKVGTEVAYPGVDKSVPGEPRKYHKYYQWVSFVLFIQALFFIVPRYIWKIFENDKIKTLVMGLNHQLIKNTEKKEKVEMLANYLKSTKGTNNLYFYYYVFCEVLNFSNVLLQMYLIDVFLGGEFSKYGLEVIQFSEMESEYRVDPMIRIFPRLTKCNFHKFGSSGDVVKHDSICLLPLNIVNEKIYIFLWFWFYFLAFVSAMILIYRMAIIASPALRFLVLRSRACLTDKKHLKIVLRNSEIGDWFVIHLLSKNIDGQHFKDLIQEYSNELVGTVDYDKNNLNRSLKDREIGFV